MTCSRKYFSGMQLRYYSVHYTFQSFNRNLFQHYARKEFEFQTRTFEVLAKVRSLHFGFAANFVYLNCEVCIASRVVVTGTFSTFSESACYIN